MIFALNYCLAIIRERIQNEGLMSTYHRRELAATLARQLLKPGVIDEGIRSGIFLSSPRSTGKTTSLVNDLVPELEAMVAITIYVDFWSNTFLAPFEL